MPVWQSGTRLDPTARQRAASRVVPLVLVCLAGLSCISLYEAAHPLSAEAGKVQIAPSGQAMSVELADHCTRVGRIQPVMSEHFAKLRADELDANVAQVLTVSEVNGRPQRLDVRFFQCPRDLSRLQLELPPDR